MKNVQLFLNSGRCILNKNVFKQEDLYSALREKLLAIWLKFNKSLSIILLMYNEIYSYLQHNFVLF